MIERRLEEHLTEAETEARRVRNHKIQWELIKKARELGVDTLYLAAEVIIAFEGKMPRLRHVEPTQVMPAADRVAAGG